MIITVIMVFSFAEATRDITWTNHMQYLSAKTHNHKSVDRIIESHPLNEGFILLTGNSNNPPEIKTKSSSPSVDTQISVSYNTSSTTCKSVTKEKTVDRTALPNGGPSLGQRLLNEPSYKTGIETATEDDGEIGSFLKVDEEEMHRQLINIGVQSDGSGDTTDQTTEETSEVTTVSLEPITSQPIATNTTASVIPSTSTSVTSSITITTIPPEITSLSSNTTFIITLDCANASITLKETLAQFDIEFKPNFYNVTYDENALQCNDSDKVNLKFNVFTDNDITTLNSLFRILENITLSMGTELRSVDTCGENSGTILVVNVTSCYLIKLCHLCGRNPIRGECYPETGLTECRCFPDVNNPSRPYVGKLCEGHDVNPMTFRYTTIIIAILASVAGLFCVITSYLLVMTFLNHRRRHTRRANIPDPPEVRDSWNLPRVHMPTLVTTENVQNYSNDAVLTSNNDHTESTTIDDIFFKELDRKINEKSRDYDPIDELDAIIGDEDTAMTFFDPFNDLFQIDEMLEVTNPNLKLPRLNNDS